MRCVNPQAAKRTLTLLIQVLQGAGNLINRRPQLFKQAKTGVLDAFFLRYQRDGEGRKSFLDWVRDDYDATALQRDFQANGLASFINDWVLAHG